MKLTRLVILVLLCLPLMGQQYNIPFSPAAAATGTLTSLLVTGVNSDWVSGTAFMGVAGNGISTFSTQDEAKSLVAAPGTFQNMRVWLDEDIGPNNDDCTISLMLNGSKGGSPADFECAIEGAGGPLQTNCADTTNTLAVVAGDEIAWQVVCVGTPAGEPQIITEFIADTDQYSLLTGGCTGIDTPADRWMPIMGTKSSCESVDEQDIKMVVPTAGVIHSLYVELSVAPGSGDSRLFTVWKNGAAETGVECTISGTATPPICNSTGTDIQADVGDTFSVRMDSTGATNPAVAEMWIGLVFEADTDDEFIISVTHDNETDNTATEYSATHHIDLTWETTQAQMARRYGRAIDITNMQVLIETDPGVGNSYQINLREDDSMVMQCTVSSGSTTCADSVDESIAAQATLDYELIPTSTPTVSGSIAFALAVTLP